MSEKVPTRLPTLDLPFLSQPYEASSVEERTNVILEQLKPFEEGLWNIVGIDARMKWLGSRHPEMGHKDIVAAHIQLI